MVLQTVTGVQFTFGFAKRVCPMGIGIASGSLFLFLIIIRRRCLHDGEKSYLVQLTELNEADCGP